MSDPREAHRKWAHREAQIGACWLIVLLGLLGLMVVQWRNDPAFEEPLTWVVAALFSGVLVAGLADDLWGRGKKNRKIRAAHRQKDEGPR